MAASLNDYLTAGQTAFSDALFAHYQETSLTPREFLVYLFLAQWGQHHPEAPALEDLAKAVKMPARDTYAVINTLIQKKTIQLVSTRDAAGRSTDEYDVSPLLDQVLTGAPAATPQTPSAAPQQVFSDIEIEFGRPLSPIEQQTINDWLTTDHYDPGVIQLALREAVLNQAYSLRYMDRILINWEKRHLTTVQQVKAAQARDSAL